MDDVSWQDQLLIDKSALAEYAAIEAAQPGFLKQLVSMFSESTETQLSHLERAIEAGDAAAVKLHAHTLKGSGLSLGAMRMVALAKAIEACGSAGSCPDISEVDQLREQRDAALDELKRSL